MGTILEITLVTSDPARARVLIDRCITEGERLEMIFTTWREDGELARLNASAGQGPQPASPELVRILLDAQRFARETDGAFDVTVGPPIALWRTAAERGAIPSDEEIATARARVGADRIQIDDARGTIAFPAGMSVDLGGLAKGWTLDRLGELLRANGIDRALLNFGGSSLLPMGRPVDAPAWTVLTEDGVAAIEHSTSESSSFGQLIEIGGERFSHIIDPRSGRPIRHERRATVEAENGAIAEAWSTAEVVFSTEEMCAERVRPGVLGLSVLRSKGDQRELRECEP